MNRYYVSVDPVTLEGEFFGNDADEAATAAINEWCQGLDEACDAVCAGTFNVTLSEENVEVEA